MSSEVEHIALANRNHDVLEYLLQDPACCCEWIAVVAFYKALHVVEAIFSQDTSIGHTHNHHDRLEILKRNQKYKILFPTYRVLWSTSLVARYLETRNPSVSGSLQSFAQFQDYLPTVNLRPFLLDRFLLVFEGEATILLGSASGSLKRYSPGANPPQGLAQE